MSSSKCPHVDVVGSLDWPSTESLTTISVLAGGSSFLDFELRRLQVRTIRHGTASFLSTDSSDSDDSDDDAPVERQVDLLLLSESQLEELDFYQVLEVPHHATFQRIKKAYHDACRLYHSDKTGKSEDDYVFLKIKAAFDTLSDDDKRRSYDSVSLTFDDSIPSGGESAKDFYSTYGPVFERNLRFDAKLRNTTSKHSPPSFGNDTTPIDKVHEFYDYWIHFDSWRDFTLKASLETKQDTDTADSRYEKRWMQKEITRKSKQLKKQEVARISLLVERSMAADPRLLRERQRIQQEKQAKLQARLEKERMEKEKRQFEQEEKRKQEQERLEQERKEKAELKAIREAEKKQLRKTRQSFRKLAMTAHQQDQDQQGVWESLEEMNDDVELLCSKLTQVQLSTLVNELSENGSSDEVTPTATACRDIQEHAAQTRAGISEEEIQAQREREQARANVDKKARLAKASRAAAPWTREELSALAKAVKKYPAGGANRWETIALFINNVCKPTTPRTKEECIETYNQIQRGNAPNKTAAAAAATSKQSTSASSNDANAWTDAQDKQLQEGLKQFPGTMDKNERWTAIAKGVDGKTKKECVQRFKAIRAALKNK